MLQAQLQDELPGMSKMPYVDVIFEYSLDVVLAGCHGDQSVKLLNAVVVRHEFCCMGIQ